MSSIRERYDALKLKVLDKVEIPNAGWQALEKGSDNQSDPDYKMALPIIVARYKAAGAKQMVIASHFIPYVGAIRYGRPSMSTRYVPAYIQYKSDILAIDNAFFGENRCTFYDSLAGRFTRAQTSRVHVDGAFNPAERSYLSRIEALPVLFIRRSELAALEPQQREYAESLIRRANSKKPEDAAAIIEAKQELAGMGLLKPLPLGDVGLFTARYSPPTEEKMGMHKVMQDDLLETLDTLHSSSELPLKNGMPQSTISAFQRSVFTAQRSPR